MHLSNTWPAQHAHCQSGTTTAYRNFRQLHANTTGIGIPPALKYHRCCTCWLADSLFSNWANKAFLRSVAGFGRLHMLEKPPVNNLDTNSLNSRASRTPLCTFANRMLVQEFDLIWPRELAKSCKPSRNGRPNEELLGSAALSEDCAWHGFSVRAFLTLHYPVSHNCGRRTCKIWCRFKWCK